MCAQVFSMGYILENREKGENIVKFLKEVEQATDLKNLTPELVRELLERIEIGERIVDEYGKKSQEVVLHYRFIGKVDELMGK